MNATKTAPRARSLNERLAPYPYFGRLREAGRAVRVHTVFAGEGWLITRYEDARALATDPRLSVEDRHANPEQRRRLDEFAFRFVDCLPDTMIILDPPTHARLRRMVSSEFTPRRISALGAYTRNVVRGLLDGLPRHRRVDFVPAVAKPVPVAAIGRLMGLGERDGAALQSLTAALALLPVDATAISQIQQARSSLWDQLSTLIEHKRHHPDDALLSALIRLHDQDGRLSHRELVAMAGVLITGGVETTARMIASGLLLLLRHPDQMSRLTADPTLVPAAIDEMLRFESPITLGLIRYAAQDIAVGDVTIRQGDLVFLGTATANHDPRRFPDPEKVDVARGDCAHLTFGHGVHYCIGAPLARLELQAVFSELIVRYPRIQLACDPAEVPWHPSVLRGPAALPVRLEPTGRPGACPP